MHWLIKPIIPDQVTIWLSKMRTKRFHTTILKNNRKPFQIFKFEYKTGIRIINNGLIPILKLILATMPRNTRFRSCNSFSTKKMRLQNKSDTTVMEKMDLMFLIASELSLLIGLWEFIPNARRGWPKRPYTSLWLFLTASLQNTTSQATSWSISESHVCSLQQSMKIWTHQQQISSVCLPIHTGLQLAIYSLWSTIFCSLSISMCSSQPPTNSLSSFVTWSKLHKRIEFSVSSSLR